MTLICCTQLPMPLSLCQIICKLTLILPDLVLLDLILFLDSEHITCFSWPWNQGPVLPDPGLNIIGLFYPVLLCSPPAHLCFTLTGYLAEQPLHLLALSSDPLLYVTLFLFWLCFYLVNLPVFSVLDSDPCLCFVLFVFMELKSDMHI